MRSALFYFAYMASLLMRAASVTNSSFELNTTDGGSTYQPLYAGFAGLPGWRFSANPATVLIGTPDENYPYKTPFGRWQVDLSGSDNITGGWIETDVTGLVAGRAYRLEFSIGVSTAFLASAGSPSLRVMIDGAENRFTATPAQIIEWQPQGADFQATGPTATVRFENTSPVGTGLISVDNVSVREVVRQQISIERQPDDRVRLLFTGPIEKSEDLREWQTETNLVSGALLTPDRTARFYRIAAN